MYTIKSPQPTSRRSIIAIVDAYRYNSGYYAWNDLVTFCNHYNLPYPSLYGNLSTGSPTFITNTTAVSAIASQSQPTFFEWVPSTTSLPPYDTTRTGWTPEMALDVQMAWGTAIGSQSGSGVATVGPHIILVHANSASNSDILTAIQGAVACGADVVSMSFGSYQFITSFEQTFRKANVTFVASSGDTIGRPCHPSTSSNVVGIGGTTLLVSGNLSSIQRVSETLWNNSSGGSGYGQMSVSSAYIQPAYQRQNYIGISSKSKNTPDISFVGDPYTGMQICINQVIGSSTQYGGTSMSAPGFAAIISNANQIRFNAGRNALTTLNVLEALYSYSASNNTIGTGKNYIAGSQNNSYVFDLVVTDTIVKYSPLSGMGVSSGNTSNLTERLSSALVQA